MGIDQYFSHMQAEMYSRAADGDAASGSYEYPYSRLQQIGFFILFFFPSLALLFFTLRMYGRISAKQLGWDDALIAMAMAFSIAETGCSYKAMRTGFLGVHVYDIPPQADRVLGQKWNYTIQILYNPILALVKTSVLMFLLRLSGQKREVRFAILGLLVFNIGLMIGIFLSAVFQCSPVSYFWEQFATVPPEGTCFDLGAFYVATGALTILTDVLVLALPFWIFIGLKMALKLKIALIGVFSMGAIVTVMGALRLAWIYEVSYHPNLEDPTYDIRFTYSAVETNLAIITASAPALRGLFVKWFAGILSTVKSGNTRATDQYGQSTDKLSKTNNTVRSGLHSNSFPMKDYKNRSEIRSKSPSASEEEIMTYNGILKTSEVAVDYGDGGSTRGRDGHAEGHGNQTRFDWRTSSGSL